MNDTAVTDVGATNPTILFFLREIYKHYYEEGSKRGL